MKKTYQNPEMKVVDIQVSQMIAASPGGYDKTLNGTPTGGSSALSRRNKFWDDEDDFGDEY